MEFLNEIGAKVDNMLQDRTTSIVVSVVLALYAGLAAPKLPNSVVMFFDTMIGKVLFLFLIGFMASRNVQVALMIAVAYVVTLHIANKRTTEEYINFLKRERFMNYYELFATADEVKEKNKKALGTKLCEKIKELSGSLADDKKLFDGDKLKDADKDITVVDALKKINEALPDDKKMLKDGNLDMDKVMGDNGLLKGLVLKKLDGENEADASAEDAKAVLKELVPTMMSMKLADLLKECAAASSESEYFTNYEDETFESAHQNDEEFLDESQEMMEDGSGDEPEQGADELFDPNETDDLPEGGEFYEDMEQFENFNVVPADNLNGNPNKMFAPVSF